MLAASGIKNPRNKPNRAMRCARTFEDLLCHSGHSMTQWLDTSKSPCDSGEMIDESESRQDDFGWCRRCAPSRRNSKPQMGETADAVEPISESLRAGARICRGLCEPVRTRSVAIPNPFVERVRTALNGFERVRTAFLYSKNSLPVPPSAQILE